MLEEHPDELRADLQQYYGVDLDELGASLSPVRASALMAQLPEGARVWAAYDERARWTGPLALSAAQVNALNWLVWAQTKDGRRNRNRPRLVGPFEDGRTRKKGAVAMTVEELQEFLRKPRRAMPKA